MKIRDNFCKFCMKTCVVTPNFCKFCIKMCVVTPHLNRPIRTVQMRGHNIMVSVRNMKNYPSIIIKYSVLTGALSCLLSQDFAVEKF